MMRLVRVRSKAAVLTAFGCLAVGATFAQPSSAADCTGVLRAQMNFAVPSQFRVPPPDGLDYATQPMADLTATEHVVGSLGASRDNACPVAGATARVSSRDAGTTEFSARRTGSTNSQGYIDFQVTPPRTTYLRGSVSVGDESAQTAPVGRTVRPFVRAQFTSASGCVMLAEGSTYPAKPNHPVWLQRRITQSGRETGYSTVRKGVTDANGNFRLAYSAPCGADYALATYLPASATNTAGRGIYVDLHVQAAR